MTTELYQHTLFSLENENLIGRTVRLKRFGGSAMHGVLLKQPDDVTRTYHIQPEVGSEGSSYPYPTTVISDIDIESIVPIDIPSQPTS